jgi:ABC-type branched-subunit amino acid transport system substrate-binding protein
MLALAGCSTQATSAVTVSGKTLTIYYSRPPAGAGGQQASDVVEAEQLAARQAGGAAGKFTLRFVGLDGAELSANARTAVQNQSAIAYVGEVQPGTSQQSVPITNELGLLEVSPTDTGMYLTQATPAVSASPGTFYPSSSSFHKTFARVVPTTAHEATALISVMHSLGLTKLFVASDGSDYGASIALEIRDDAAAGGLSVVASATGADAIFYGAAAGQTATRALDQFATADPSARLFAPSGVYDDSFVAGLSPAAQRNLYVSSPGFMPDGLSALGRQFESDFKAAYGHAPAPEAVFGYEAVSALVSVLDGLGSQAASRADVVSAYRSLRDRRSVLGEYSIVGGDTTIAPFIVARPQGGRLVPRSAA